MGVVVNTAETNQDQFGETEISEMTTALMGPESLPLNRQALEEDEQRDSPSLGYALKMVTCAREVRDLPTGCFVKDSILFRNCCQEVLPSFQVLETPCSVLIESLAVNAVLPRKYGCCIL